MATDEALAARLVEGDDAALRELLQRYERPVAHFIHRHTGGRDVEDLYQETWTRVVSRAATFDPARRFSTWLFQIALNLCRDWHRRPPPEPVQSADEPVAADDLGRAEAGLDARRLLRQLSEAHREVVILRYYNDMSEEETAAVLGCPKGTVKSRLHQALARLSALASEKRP